MKRIFLFLSLAFITLSIGCTERGTTYSMLSGQENALPPELKGLKVYRVILGEGESIYVAVLDGNVSNNKVTSLVTGGKYSDTTIMVDVAKEKIVYENDSVILIKK